MKLNTGAAVSVMSEKQWEEMFGKTKSLHPYEGRHLQGYSGHELQFIGQGVSHSACRVCPTNKTIAPTHCGWKAETCSLWP